MKKVWEQYSYVIILAAVCLIATLAISNKFNQSNEFLYVTVNQGESLWEIAEKFEGSHSMSANEFIQWVEDKNGIKGDTIFPGEELIIPVVNDSISDQPVTVLAGE